MDLLPSSAVNMVIKILYFGIMEGGDCYYAFFLKIYLIGYPIFELVYLNMNLNDKL